ncbi:NAD(P)-binding Rossmann-fold superfamily protein [Striga asiatica]|uniref:NAD(P)-binding Rossmann-fold superfamily protein n=1 Tax=Striga asiatica TaxID=4170 RepID=A0A5A7P9Q4_STRAF|nr:NAD(P)-binding Rossmann-fold superfamily protein [Striga asiatica]
MFLVKTWRSISFGLYGYKNFTKSGFMEHSKNFNPEDMQMQIEGKNCVVTGANSGIGYSTAEGLASRGATVYMVCRNKERGEAALSEIQSATGNKNVYLEVCDISSISDVKSFVSRFSSRDVPIHVLVNNAGLLENKRLITSEGFEMNFAVNVLGTYTLTELMLPLLEKAVPDARVITVSSGGMYTSPLMEDLQFNGNKFDGVEQYARNKRVQFVNAPIDFTSAIQFRVRLSGKLRSSKEGADTVIWLALQPKEKLVSGSFYFDRAEVPKHLPVAVTNGSHSVIDRICGNLRALSRL